MMFGMVLAALYASPTTVPIATPMMRVRRKPVARDAIVPSAMLRLVRSAPAGVPDLPPIDRRLPGRVPEPSDRPGERAQLGRAAGRFRRSTTLPFSRPAASGRGQEQMTQDLWGGAVEHHVRGVGARVHLAGEADGLEGPGRMDEHGSLPLEAGQLPGERRAHDPPLGRVREVGLEMLGPGRGTAADTDDPGTGPRHRPDQRLPD